MIETMQSYRHQAVQQSPASLVRLIIHFNYLTLHCSIHCKCRGCIYIIIIYTARLGQVTALAWSTQLILSMDGFTYS